MGCGIACVALALNKTYKSTKRLFDSLLISVKHNEKNLLKTGTIVFIERSKKYPLGHYLIKTNNGWMNPWINFPKINPAKSGFQKNLPGKVQWIIYQKE